MTRKHYVAIAKVVAALEDRKTAAEVVRELVPILKGDNRAFSADKFAAACGVPATFGY